MNTTGRPRGPVYGDLVSLLEGGTWWGYFERCCCEGEEKLLSEVGRFRDALVASGADCTEEMVRVGLLELACELHPGSPAAKPSREHGEASGRDTGVAAMELSPSTVAATASPVVLVDDIGKDAPEAASGYDVVEDDAIGEGNDEQPEPDDDDGPVKIETAKDVIVFLLDRGEDFWHGYFENLCRHAESLRIAGGREFHWKSRQMGWSFSREEIEDTLFELAGERLPDAPATWWDTAWAADLYRRATAYLDEHGIREALTADEEAGHVFRADRAIAENDRIGYRRALREWMAAARAAASDGSPPSV